MKSGGKVTQRRSRSVAVRTGFLYSPFGNDPAARLIRRLNLPVFPMSLRYGKDQPLIHREES